MYGLIEYTISYTRILICVCLAIMILAVLFIYKHMVLFIVLKGSKYLSCIYVYKYIVLLFADKSFQIQLFNKHEKSISDFLIT